MNSNSVRSVRRPLISVVVTAHNEGDEVRRTIDSIRANTNAPCEILLIDDGSTDKSCDFGEDVSGLQIIRHREKIGIAHSRAEASKRARGDVIAYFDAHQRVEPDCLEQCMALAMSRNAIVCPDIIGFQSASRRHGAYFVLEKTRKHFAAEWKLRAPRGGVGRVTALCAPTYLIPKHVYPLVGWSGALRGWGGSEASVSLKAFFTGVEILHLCGPLVHHQFKTQFHYEVKWPEVWRNHAIIARTCFDERTWYDYWLPEVFDSHLTSEMRTELESPAIRAEQADFARIKVRRDEEFWTHLIFEKPPASIQ